MFEWLATGSNMESLFMLASGEYQLTPIVKAINVIPDLSLTERIDKYCWFDSDLDEKMFPHDPTTVGEWEWKLVHIDRDISSEDAKSAVEVDGWSPAKAEHLLTFGAMFPEEQRKYPIVALGSVGEPDGRRLVLILDTDDSGRHLDLCGWCGDWHRIFRFLVVRKVQS
jgi:hypothetical protein